MDPFGNTRIKEAVYVRHNYTQAAPIRGRLFYFPKTQTMINTKPIKSLKQKIRLLQAQIGQTPLVRLPEPFSTESVSIYAKLEWQQLGHSVKARAAYQIFKDAIEAGKLDNQKTLLDASSGNTAIAYAAIGAHLGIRVHICLPENASKKRKSLLKMLGAEVTYTDPFEGTDGAQETAARMAEAYPEQFYYADQYNNPSNRKAHYLTTGPEIIWQLQKVTHFICGLGTTGSFSGTSEYLAEVKPSVERIQVQPNSALHGLEGWKHLPTAKVPGIFRKDLAEQALSVDTVEALDVLKDVARHTGMLISPSSAANLKSAMQLAQTIESGHIVTLFPDDLMKYDEILNQIL